jgi:hypothetical protein
MHPRSDRTAGGDGSTSLWSLRPGACDRGFQRGAAETAWCFGRFAWPGVAEGAKDLFGLGGVVQDLWIGMPQ